MRALVTGAAGFIGSTLVDRLLILGWDVRGLDSLDSYYDPRVKMANLASARLNEKFEFIEVDLISADLVPVFDSVDVVFHQAGQPGVRKSWSDGFTAYVDANIVVTQRLLEQARLMPVDRFVFASSSSVYGDVWQVPTTEAAPTSPISPYGVTKLAAEKLCTAYASNFGIPTVSLRYFTVYGPRQRPDMAIHRLIESALGAGSFRLYGDGSQERDFTFVDDVVDANIRAATVELEPGRVVNVAGGGSIEMRHLVTLVEEAVGSPIQLQMLPPSPGDVRRTGGDTNLAHKVLGWEPTVGIQAGVATQADWQRKRDAEAPG